jgi:hypothetical protein
MSLSTITIITPPEGVMTVMVIAVGMFPVMDSLKLDVILASLGKNCLMCSHR